MPVNKKPKMQTRDAQLGIKIDAELYEKYKTKLKEDGMSITENIENHMRNYVGEMIVHNNVVDIAKLVEDVEALKKCLGELQSDWQERMSNLKVS
jgi:ubiquinone biosynthesis protein UbiJ